MWIHVLYNVPKKILYPLTKVCLCLSVEPFVSFVKRKHLYPKADINIGKFNTEEFLH